MKIKFNEESWVLEQICGGFDGDYFVRGIKVGTNPINFISIERDKHKQCSDIYMWSDGCADGNKQYLINVPNGIFKIVE